MVLENEEYIVKFDAHGGEIASVVRKGLELEYMYQGDTEYWGGKNPTLFPIVGSTYSKSYEIDDKTYAMKNHGLIRYATLVGKSYEDRIEFTYESNEETLSVYPFDFSYKISYQLDGSTLVVSYDIKNTGNRVMPFTFGLHPGFKCPIQLDETFEDYTFSFEQDEKCEMFDYVSREYKEIEVKDISLGYDLFTVQETLIYKGIKSEAFTLEGKRHGVRLDVSGNEDHYPILALWTPKKGAPFICIEPWLATNDLVENDKNFYEREGTFLLEEQDTFKTSYRITFF